jgi:aspartate dehydrogenase
MAAAPPRAPCRVGLIGFGALGQHLFACMRDAPADFQVAWIWNRTPDKVAAFPGVAPAQVLPDLAAFAARGAVDLLIEVCHPRVTAQHGAALLAHAPLFLGSPTALADAPLEAALRRASAASGFALYVPAGALWGAGDLAKMGAAGSLAALRVTMKKHPASLQLEGGAPAAALAAAVAAGTPGETVVYEGPVRALALCAPNNTNTMAAAALAAENLGFDGVQARLVSDPSLAAHVVIVEAEGRPGADGSRFTCTTVRTNPAAPGAVTGAATFASFYASLRLAARAGVGGPGIHLL